MNDSSAKFVDGSSVSRVVGYAYPWDVIGDPGFLSRLEMLGIEEVALAAAYHGTRAATPLHPSHRLVEARSAALYRPVRDAVWRSSALRPAPATWMDSVDPFAEATSALTARGVAVNAWVVLAHSSRLGAQFPALTVRNCFGDRYSYALCISHDEVLDYVATLAAEAVRDAPIAGVSVEGCGQLGVAHNGLHEKTVGAYGPAAERILSVCCCSGCEKAWSAAGLDPNGVRSRLRSALLAVQTRGLGSDADMERALGDELAGKLLKIRLALQDAARERVLAALRHAAPGARITLHGHPDRWATGASPAVTTQAAGEVDAVLVPAWPATPSTYDAVAAARQVAPESVSVAAYVSVLPPVDAATVGGHARQLVAAGADELHLYHLGLANQSQLDAMGELVLIGRGVSS